MTGFSVGLVRHPGADKSYVLILNMELSVGMWPVICDKVRQVLRDSQHLSVPQRLENLEGGVEALKNQSEATQIARQKGRIIRNGPKSI